MRNEHILFEYSPAFILLCVAVGIGYAALLYRKTRHSWGAQTNRLLFFLRAVLVFLIAFLLIGPILKLTHNTTEKPTLTLLVDNSESVKEALDSGHRNELIQQLTVLRKSLQEEGYDVVWHDLAGEAPAVEAFNHPTSDLAGSIRDVIGEYEGKNLAGIVLVSDGIYNSGSSPLYTPSRIPVYTLGIGDTASRVDLAVKNLDYNKIAYQGNQFPLRAEVLVDGLANDDIRVSVFQAGKLVRQLTKNSGTKPLIDFDFQLEAHEKGLQRIEVVIDPADPEKNIKNNRTTAFVEVVEGKKKILLIAPAPHPDIKALRSVIEKNSNYEFILHIPGVKEADAEILRPGKADLIIFHQATDVQGKTAALFSMLAKGPSPIMVTIGTGTNLRALGPAGIPVAFEKAGWDDATPVINPDFHDFDLSENSSSIFSKYPPVVIPFGKLTYPSQAAVLLRQQIGSVATDRPLLFAYDDNGRKWGVLVGDGIWRWRMGEFYDRGKADAFDELFSKFIQYLSSHEDKRRFKSFPLQHEFKDSEPVEFESQVYNDLYEPVYGNTIALTITDDAGKATSYHYITSLGGSRYRIGGLKEGIYKYQASTIAGGKAEEVRGEFLVKAQNIEAQNLMADFGLLRKLAENTGGTFHPATAMRQLNADLMKMGAKGIIHTEESFDPLINLKWVFFLLLALISTEWFLRKYFGAY